MILREASYEDAIALAERLNLNKEEVWKIIKGLKCRTQSELGMAIHNAFKVSSGDTGQPEG